MKKLLEIDTQWRARLQGADCPPLLGLAPLDDDEREAISREVDGAIANLVPRPGHQPQGVVWLLRRYPAVIALWLSRLAGEAYDAGNFWERFASMLGCAEVPANFRAEFATAFRRACRSVMSGFVEPEVGSFRHVGEFLFQAGLPLCHCGRFAAALRAVADAYGLPGPDDAETLRDFREAMLARAEVRQAPVVRLALEIESGIHLLAVAVRVVREDAFAEINPQLGQRLRESFLTAAAGTRGSAVRWPWLRLEEDLSSLAVVGPRQPAALLGSSGLRWVVDDASFRVGVEDEFIFPISTQARCRVELVGLAGGRPLQRDFVFHPSAESVAAFVFSMARRRVRVTMGKTCQLEAGDYWLVHPAEFALDDASESHPWFSSAAGMELLATSRLALRPGEVCVLRDGFGEPLCEFKPMVRPFIDVAGQRMIDSEESCIHFGWEKLPRVWIPSEEADCTWSLHITVEKTERVLQLQRGDGSHAGPMCPLIAAGDVEMLHALPPALHALRLEVRRNQRTVAERSLWLWHELTACTAEGFRCSASPANLIATEMRGFSREGLIIHHLDDSLRMHSLTFRIGEERMTFAWRRPGVFVESLEKYPGRPAKMREHPLGESFSASTDSRRWLRVSLVPCEDAAVLLNGAEMFRFRTGSERQSVDISLAQVSAQSEQGGRLALRRGGAELLLARVTRPLVPVIVQYSTAGGYETLLCKFPDPVRRVRVRLRELVSGRHIRFGSRDFSSSGHLLFQEADLPTIEVCNLAKDGSCSGDLHRLELDVPEQGWPAGLWIIELEVAREEGGECQPLLNARGGQMPLILNRPLPRDDTAPYRARCLAAVLAPHPAGNDPYFPPSNGHEAELAALLGEVRLWLGETFEDAAWTKLRPLQVLYGHLAKQTRWQIGNNSAAILPHLVERLLGDGERLGPRSLFVQIPDLLALPAELCGELPANDPIRGALRWAAALAAAERVCTGLRRVRTDEPFGLGEVSSAAPILREFQNSNAVLGIDAVPDGDDELTSFRYAAWFARMARETRGGFDTALDDAEALSVEHWSWAMRCFLRRRQAMSAAPQWGEIAAVFAHSKIDWLFALRMICPSIKHTFPTMVRQSVWWECEVEDDFLTGELVQFSALLTLGARTAAQRWLSFWDVLKPLREKHGPKPVQKALTTVVTQAPELLGFHLMFWELMIRTYPHD